MVGSWKVVIATLHTDLVHNLLVPLMSYLSIKPSSSYSQYFLSPMSSAQFIMVHSWMTSFTATLLIYGPLLKSYNKARDQLLQANVKSHQSQIQIKPPLLGPKIPLIASFLLFVCKINPIICQVSSSSTLFVEIRHSVIVFLPASSASISLTPPSNICCLAPRIIFFSPDHPSAFNSIIIDQNTK